MVGKVRNMGSLSPLYTAACAIVMQSVSSASWWSIHSLVSVETAGFVKVPAEICQKDGFTSQDRHGLTRRDRCSRSSNRHTLRLKWHSHLQEYLKYIGSVTAFASCDERCLRPVC